MRKYRSFGETNLKYGIFSETEKKKSDGKFPIKKFQLADFDRVSRVRRNKLIFNFGPKDSLLHLFLKLVQINVTFSHNVFCKQKCT